MTRHGSQIQAYEQLMPAHLQQFVRQFFFPKAGPLHAEAPSQLNLELVPSVTLISADRVEIVGERTAPQNPTEPKESKPNLPDKLPPKKQDLSRLFDDAGLTDRQREIMELKF
jgi:hypothetical protein